MSFNFYNIVWTLAPPVPLTLSSGKFINGLICSYISFNNIKSQICLSLDCGVWSNIGLFNFEGLSLENSGFGIDRERFRDWDPECRPLFMRRNKAVGSSWTKIFIVLKDLFTPIILNPLTENWTKNFRWSCRKVQYWTSPHGGYSFCAPR